MTPESAGGLSKVRQLVSGRARNRTWVSSHHTDSALATTRSYSPSYFKIHGLVLGAHMEATVRGEGAELD